MPFSLRCVHYMVTSILQDRQYMFGVKSLLMVEKMLLIWSLCCLDNRCNDRSSRFHHAVKLVCYGTNVYMNLDTTLKMKH